MNNRIVSTLVLAQLVLASMGVQAEDAKPKYESMAALDQYLIADRDAEIALASSAAPAAISQHATVLVLERRGYRTAVEGSNGFTCLVERSWMSPFDSAEFWNARMRGPICYNAPATRSILPYTLKRTDLALGGLSKGDMLTRIRGATARKELPIPEAGAMSYMLSRQGYLGDAAGPWHPHLMFHVPKTDGASWGANLPGSPVMLDDEHREVPEPETIFMVPVSHWSDGTAAANR